MFEKIYNLVNVLNIFLINSLMVYTIYIPLVYKKT